MKKPKKIEVEDRIDIAIDIKIENDVGPINPHNIHTLMNEDEVTQLATYIAQALNDMNALTLHVKYIRKYPKEALIAILNYVLAKPQKDITTSRAAYYNYLVRIYDRTGKYPGA